MPSVSPRLFSCPLSSCSWQEALALIPPLIGLCPLSTSLPSLRLYLFHLALLSFVIALQKMTNRARAHTHNHTPTQLQRGCTSSIRANGASRFFRTPSHFRYHTIMHGLTVHELEVGSGLVLRGGMLQRDSRLASPPPGRQMTRMGPLAGGSRWSGFVVPSLGHVRGFIGESLEETGWQGARGSLGHIRIEPALATGRRLLNPKP